MQQPHLFALPKWASRLECNNSGNCCIGQLKKWSDEDGVCSKLDKATRKCTIYEDRPSACRHFPFFGYQFDGVIEITAYLNCFGCLHEGQPNVDVEKTAILGRDVFAELNLSHAGKMLEGDAKRAYWDELKKKIKNETLLYLSQPKPLYWSQELYKHIAKHILGLENVKPPGFAEDFLSFRASCPQYIYTKESVYLLRPHEEGIEWKEIFTGRKGILSSIRNVEAEPEAGEWLGKYIDFMFDNNFTIFLTHNFFKQMTKKEWKDVVVTSSALDRVTCDAFLAILSNANLVSVLLANIENGPITGWRMRAACGYADGNAKITIPQSAQSL
ncbi:MAG TPA: YkgJ family cysteine cluster protein [Candidatus Norongarragalinales archaeon]|jgi:Fe-S-cluster containining protein|nr:YkgJ family cysteine cluster protein [Candidatus Norongarragalinales archaeon]